MPKEFPSVWARSPQPRRFHAPVLRLLPLLALLLASARAPAQQTSLRTGAEFSRQLQSTAGLSWSGVPLRNALETLGKDQQIAVFLDRRIDPGRLVDLGIAEQSLENALRTLARHQEMGVCFLDAVVYFGPQDTADKLSTVAAIRRREAEKLPRQVALRLARVRAWQWETLSTPRDLLTELADESGIEIAGLAQFPHDLWPAVELPPLSLADRLTLVLAGFGMTYQFSPDGAQLQLVPFPATAAISQIYPGKGHPRENAERIARLYPEAQVAVEGEMIRVVGPWEAHQGVELLMQGQRVARTTPPKNSGGRTVYTLKVENEPVGGVIKALAGQLKLEVTIDPAAESRLTERVSFNVADVSRDELLRAVLKPAGLSFRVTANELRIVTD
jgi:hypothetical protein